MKKLLILLVLLFFSIVSIAQNITDNLTNYEKYIIQNQKDQENAAPRSSTTESSVKDTLLTKKEWDDIYFNSKTSKSEKKVKHSRRDEDQIVDTLIKENPDINIDYYSYDNYPLFYSYNIGRFYHGGFNYWLYENPSIYNNYWITDMEDLYWGYGFYEYPFWGYPNYFGLMLGGYPWDYGRYNYWNTWRFNHNHWNNNSGYTDYVNHNSYQNKSYAYTKTGSAVRNTATKPLYVINRKTYTPSYQITSRNVRPIYNNSRVVNSQISRNNANISRRSTSRSYAIPSRSRGSTSHYSTSNSRSYNSSSNYNSGSVSRGNYSSGSSGSSGSRSSSSGSSTSGRR